MKGLYFKIAYWLSSPRLTLFLLFYAVLFIFLASIETPKLGIVGVQEKYIEAWFCLYGYLPLLGGKFIGLAVLLNLLASAFRFTNRGFGGIAFGMVHIALVLLIIAAFLQGAWRQEGRIVLLEGTSSSKIEILKSNKMYSFVDLPFSIELVKCTKTNFEHTKMPSAYSSLVKFHYANKATEKLIQMNDPASFGGWTFYQFELSENDKTSTLQAVKNPAGLLPIVSIALIFFGMIFVYMRKIFIKR